MAELKIDRVGYKYPNLFFSLNGQTFLIRIKQGSGKKWLKMGMIESVNVYPSIMNDIEGNEYYPHVRNIEKFVKNILINFPTRLENTNEPARNFIWGWRNGIYENKSGEVVS